MQPTHTNQAIRLDDARTIQPGRIEIVIVYNEPKTLRRVFLKSLGLATATLVLLDNRALSRGLPELFNQHKRVSTAEWIVFCHQDFVILDEAWLDKVRLLPPNACYGPIGVDSRGYILGRIIQTDGSPLGEPRDMPDVVALDEMCLIVPRVVYTAIDFDEQFPFDFYVHDYCQAALRADFGCRVIQLDCQHRSKSLSGDTTKARYLEARARFVAKYRDREARGLFNVSERYSNPLRADPTLKAILDIVPPSPKILQLGVGSGFLSYGLMKSGSAVNAIEPDPYRAKYARSYCNSLQVGSPEDPSLYSNVSAPYHVVLVEHLLERAADPLAVLQNAADSLEPSGTLLITLRNRRHISARYARRSGSPSRFDLGSDVASSNSALDVEAMTQLLRSANLYLYDVRRITPPLLDPELVHDPSSIPLSIFRRVATEPESTTYDFIFVAGFDAGHAMVRPHSLPTSRVEHRRALARELGLMAWHALHAEPVPSLRLARKLALRSFYVVPSLRALAYFLISCLPGFLFRFAASLRRRLFL